MGIQELNWYSSVNFLIYGLFIFIMTILFINIFTGISIDEIQRLIQHSEAHIQSRKIDYVFKVEKLNERYFLKNYRKIIKLFNEHCKCLKSILKKFGNFFTKIKKVLVNIINNKIIKII